MCPPPRVANIIAAAYICGVDTIIRMFSFVLGPLSPFYDHVGTLTVPTPSVYIFFPSQPFHVYGLTYSFAVYFLCPTHQEIFKTRPSSSILEHAQTSPS
jgi:hypothetical protein